MDNGIKSPAAAAPPWASKVCHRNFGWAVVPKSVVNIPPGLVGPGGAGGQQAVELSAQRLVAPCLGPACAIFVATEEGGLCGDLLAIVATHGHTELVREDIEADEDVDDDTDDEDAPPRDPAEQS